MTTLSADKASLAWEETAEGLVVRVGGAWTINTVGSVERTLHKSRLPKESQAVTIDASTLLHMDTAGAWLISRLLRGTTKPSKIMNLDPRFKRLLELADHVEDKVEIAPPGPFFGLRVLERIGRGVFDARDQVRDLLGFVGLVTVKLIGVLVRPKRLRVKALINQIEEVGINALPIVGLLNLLVGVVLAYQGADQLARFGAQVFTVNLLAVSILREVGILITSIIVAGRSGSAFTAQIGTMKVNQEVDAMETIGLDPIEVLVIPRVLALIIALPLLAFFANIMGLLGGGLVALFFLDLSLIQFTTQLLDAADLGTLLVGLVKAPVFAAIIALVGCFEGLRVSGSADSVGRLTTQSVVEAIFFVIIFDAAFSILFSIIGV